MKTLIRVLLVGYLAWSGLFNISAIPFWMERYTVMPVLFLVVCGLSLVAAVFLVVSPKSGRTLAVLSQIPQVIGIVTPIFAFGMYTGVLAEAGVSMMPGDPRWHVRPSFRISSGARFMGFVGVREDAQVGYAIILNLAAVCVALAAFYALRNRPNQAPLRTPVSVVPAADAPVTPPPGAAGL
jgi:hypothetical protein